MRKEQQLPSGQCGEVYRRLDEHIRSYCGLIFNQAATLEWVESNATPESAGEIAAVINSANVKYLFEADYLLYTREVLEQCHKQNPDIQVPDLPVFQNLSDNNTLCSARGILVNQVHDYLEKNELGQLEKKEGTPTQIQIASVREWVEETFKWTQKNPKTHQKRVDDFKASLSEDIRRKTEYFSDRQRYRRDWLKRFLKIDRILKAFNPQIDIDAVLDRIDITKCPAVRLYWSVREQRMRSGNPPEDNDVDDYMPIPVVPYADVVLTERNLRAFILQADENLKSKVFYKATDAVAQLEDEGFGW